MAADRAIVPDVRIRQKKIAVTHNQYGALAAKGVVLWIAANRAERIKRIVHAELRRPPHRGVRVQHAAVAQFHVLANHRVRADLHAFAKFCARRHNGLRMDFVLLHFAGSSVLATEARSTILHISVASAASCPSTVAFPSSLQKSLRHESTFISTFNWSPGTTGRRNRAPSTATK